MTSPATLLLFFARHNCPFRTLCANILREIATYFPTLLLLPALHSSYLITYNVHSACYKFLPINSSLLPERSIFCLIDGITALAVSGDEPSAKVLRVSLITGQISAFPSMLQSRILPGLIAISGVCYVFGGLRLKKHLKCAEKVTICDKTWVGLSDSQKAHLSFSPCHHKGIIYLSPLHIYHPFETFTIAKECFSLIDLHGDTSYIRPVSIIVDDCLFLIGSNGFLVQWLIGTPAKSASMATMEGNYGRLFEASCCPIRKDREITWLELTKPSKCTLLLDVQVLICEDFLLPA